MIFLCICVGISIHAQTWNSARLSVLSGHSVSFHFNSLDKIKNGITYPEALTFGVELKSNNVLGHNLKGFILKAASFNNQTTLMSDGVESIPLNFIQLHIKNKIGLDEGISEGYKALSNGMMPFFTYTPTVWRDLHTEQHQITVDIKAKDASKDVSTSIMSKPTGVYRVEIEFELMPTGDGF